MQPDIFYVVHGNFTISSTLGTPGTYSIWKIDMNPFRRGGENGIVMVPAKVSKLFSMPEALLLNGMTPLDKSRNLLLIADCRLGAIWKLNVQTLEYGIVIKNPLMNPSSDPSSLGVNSIKIRHGHLYFTNTQLGYLCRAPLDTSNGTATGAVQVLQTGLIRADDFILDEAGDVYVAQDAANVLTEVSARGKVRTLVGCLNDSYLAGATAVQFGRTELDTGVLYVTTNGGQAKPVGGRVVPGKVVAVFTETEA